MLLFDCPRCREWMSVEERKVGELVACPFCSKTVRVPGIAAQPQVTAPQLAQVQKGKTRAVIFLGLHMLTLVGGVGLAVLFPLSDEARLLGYFIAGATIIVLYAALEQLRILVGGGRGMALLLSVFLWPVGPVRCLIYLARVRVLERERRAVGLREEEQPQLQEA